jgi:leucyl aminopeptidase (aminopeptidase T)
MSLVTMVKEATIVVDHCIGIRKGERVTIATDSSRRVEAEVIASLCHAKGADILIVDLSPYVIPVVAGRYVDPPSHFKDLMKSSNVTIIVTSQEFSQRFSHKIHYFLNQTEECSVYQVDEGIGSWDYEMKDVQLIMERGKKILQAISGAKWVRIISPNGTDIKLCIEGRDCLPDLPIMPRPVMQAATPIPLWGELNWAPVEDLTNGRAVIDGILMRWGSESAVGQKVEWIVEKGRIIEIKGKDEAEEFRKTLQSADENAYVIGELGIGVSHKARLGTMEEKGRLGVVHLGVGSNKGVYPGGRNASSIHGDGSVRNVTIEVDGRKILSNETLLI